MQSYNNRTFLRVRQSKYTSLPDLPFFDATQDQQTNTSCTSNPDDPLRLVEYLQPDKTDDETRAFLFWPFAIVIQESASWGNTSVAKTPLL